jgi:hypothetical protein
MTLGPPSSSSASTPANPFRQHSENRESDANHAMHRFGTEHRGVASIGIGGGGQVSGGRALRCY